MEPGKQTVLVVDDEKNIRKTLRMVLESEGYAVAEAESAEQALEVLRSEPVDLGVFDIRLPGMDGLTLLSKARELWRDLPVIVISGDEDAFGENSILQHDRARGNESIGIYFCIIKNNRPHADEAVSPDGARVRDGSVSHGHIIADDERVAFMADMEEAPVLDIRPLADTDIIHIAADDRVEPHARIFPDADIADDLGAGGCEDARMEFRHAAAVGMDHFDFPFTARGGLQLERFHFMSSMRILPMRTFIFAMTGTRAASLLNHPSNPPVRPKMPTKPASPSK